MDEKTHKYLEQAKVHFLNWKMAEAYNLFRRYFDRLPFSPEAQHSEYIGYFVRVLLELGKKSELEFYVRALEQNPNCARDPALAYQLAYLYSFQEGRGHEKAREIFERLIADPSAIHFRTKALIMLADYYDRIKKDTAKCKELIDSISNSPEGPCDEQILPYVDIWRAKIFRDTGNLCQAQSRYLEVLKNFPAKKSWYVHFSAKVGLAITYARNKEVTRAYEILNELKSTFQKRRFKSTFLQLAEVQKEIDELHGTFRQAQTPTSAIEPMNAGVTTRGTRCFSQKMLELFSKKQHIQKAELAERLYNRTYVSERDDKLIHYHIHALRKRLKVMGLPHNTIQSRSGGYQVSSSLKSLCRQTRNPGNRQKQPCQTRKGTS